MGAERRRSDRYEQALPVDIHDRRGTRRASTLDVGRHGIFVEVDDPPADCMLLRLTVHLPDGPIPVLAAVVRRSEDADMRGVGLQFFAIDEAAKDCWDRHIAGLRGEHMLPAEQRSHVRHAATFLVRVRELDRLQELHTRDVSAGGFFLVSPVLRHVGSEVNLVFVHPGTLEEFTVRGAVTRVQTSGIPGMGIRLHHFTDESREAFRSFMETGIVAISQQPSSFLESPDEQTFEEIAVQPGDIESVELDPLELSSAPMDTTDDRAWREAEAEKEIAAVRAAEEATAEFGLEAAPRLVFASTLDEPWPAAIDDAAVIEVTAPAAEPPEVAPAPMAVAPEEAAPAEVASEEVAPVEVAPVEVTAVEVAPVEVTAVEVAPVEVAPLEVALVEVAPVEVAAPEAPPAPAPPPRAPRPAPARADPPPHAEPAPRRGAGDLATMASQIDDRPDAIDVRLRLAAKLLSAGRGREALEQAAAAVRLDARHPIALASLARALVAMGRPDDAEKALVRARRAGYLGDERITAEIARLRTGAR